MADQPQTPNAARISGMLQDLAAQKAGSAPATAPAPMPARPAASVPPPPPPLPAAPQKTPPMNLPVAPTPTAAPMPPSVMTPPSRPTAPPPAPREQTVSVAPLPKAPTPPAIPAPIVKPSTPLTPAAPVVAPQKPASAEVSTELRTMTADIGNLRVGQAPQGIKPPSATQSVQAPSAGAVPPIQPPAITPPSVVIAPPSDSGSGAIKKIVYGLVGVLILLGIGYSLISLMSGGSDEPTASATPSSSATPSAALEVAGKTLRTYFPQAGATISLRDDDSAILDFQNALITSQPSAGQAVRLIIEAAWPDKSAYGFLSAMTGTAPVSLQEALGSDWTVLAYGQKEVFDANGMKLDTAGTTARVVLIAEVTNASGAGQAMTAWEGSALASSADMLLGYDFAKAIVNEFSAGTYRSLQVRYRNFPYADSSIDYAVITASNNKNYLILSASRESMFFVIDQLMQ